MRKFNLFTLVFVLLSFIAQAQSTESRKLESFSGIRVSEGIEATLVAGNTESIDISTEGNITTKEVLTELQDGKMKIHLEDNRRYLRVKVKVKVTYKTLTSISANSAARINIADNIDNLTNLSASSAGSIYSTGTFKGNELEVRASSAGSIEGKIQATNLQIRVSSSGDVRLLGGSTGSLTVNGSSSGDVKGYDFTCESAEVRVSSGASVRVNVAKAIEARASSGASVVYAGTPQKVNVRTSSGGSIRQR